MWALHIWAFLALILYKISHQMHQVSREVGNYYNTVNTLYFKQLNSHYYNRMIVVVIDDRNKIVNKNQEL